MSKLSRCWYVHIMYQCYFTRFQHYEVVSFQINFITDFFCVVSIEIKRYLSSLRKIIRLLIARLSWHLLRVSFAGFQRSVGFECLDGHNWLISESVTRIRKTAKSSEEMNTLFKTNNMGPLRVPESWYKPPSSISWSLHSPILL